MVLTVLIVIACGLFVLVKVASTASRTKERAQHRDRCTFCGTRLKKLPGKAHFAGTCHKCGRMQPWTESAQQA